MSRSICGYPPRLFGFAIAVSAIALPIVAWAVARLGTGSYSATALVGTALFLVCALVV